MSVPLQVSPLIKTARWGLLVLGIAYGYKHKQTVKRWREKERVGEIEARENYIRQKTEEKAKSQREFERTSILYQK